VGIHNAKSGVAYHLVTIKDENVWKTTYCWKARNEGYNIALDLTSVGGVHKKLWASKLVRVPITGISRLSTWES